MNKFKVILLSMSILANSAFADNVVATFKGGEIKESQVMNQFKAALEMQPDGKNKAFKDYDANTQESLVRAYFHSMSLNEEAKTANIEASKEFQDKLNLAKGQLLQQEVIERYIKANVTDKMIDAEYGKVVENLKGKEEIKVSHILVDTEEKAKEVKKKLSKGAKFEVVAKDMSSDEGSKSNGGELGYMPKGSLVPEFENKAFAMKVNEISEPVKTQFGWHIIKLLDKRPIKVPSKEEAKATINSKLSNDVVQKYFSDIDAKADLKLAIPGKAVLEAVPVAPTTATPAAK